MASSHLVGSLGNAFSKITVPVTIQFVPGSFQEVDVFTSDYSAAKCCCHLCGALFEVINTVVVKPAFTIDEKLPHVFNWLTGHFSYPEIAHLIEF